MDQEILEASAFYAFQYGNISLIKKILTCKNFDINKPLLNQFPADYFDDYSQYYSPLHLVLANRTGLLEKEVITLLQICLDHGADVNIGPKPSSPIWPNFFNLFLKKFVCRINSSYVPLVKSFIKAGAKVDIKTDYKRNMPLCIVASALDEYLTNITSPNRLRKLEPTCTSLKSLLNELVLLGAYPQKSLSQELTSETLKLYFLDLPFLFLFYCFSKKALEILF